MDADRRRPAARRLLAAAAAVAIHVALLQLFMPDVLRTRAIPGAQIRPLTVFLIATPSHAVNGRMLTSSRRHHRHGHAAAHETIRSRSRKSIAIVSSGVRSRHMIHWMGALRREVRDLQSGTTVSKRHFGLPRGEDFEPSQRMHPWDGWDYAVTHRIQEQPTGGTLIMINDHCGIVFAPLPIVGCALGKIKANGNLFGHMNDARGQGPGSLP